MPRKWLFLGWDSSSLKSAPSPLIMGILNVTPDSFSDGGHYLEVETAVARAWEIAGQGAHLLDIGGESSRPGAEPVPEDLELRRVFPVVHELCKSRYPLPISIDTTKSHVADVCLGAGARIVNDITALRGDPTMIEVVYEYNAGLVLMHMWGTPRTMQQKPAYKNVLEEIRNFLGGRFDFAVEHGIPREQIILDPGIGFGKTLEHNLTLLRRVDDLGRSLNAPILVGPSRKQFLGEILNEASPEKRLEGVLATVGEMALKGVEAVRVHDVAETKRFLKTLHVLRSGTHRNNLAL